MTRYRHAHILTHFAEALLEAEARFNGLEEQLKRDQKLHATEKVSHLGLAAAALAAVVPGATAPPAAVPAGCSAS